MTHGLPTDQSEEPLFLQGGVRIAPEGRGLGAGQRRLQQPVIPDGHLATKRSLCDVEQLGQRQKDH